MKEDDTLDAELKDCLLEEAREMIKFDEILTKYKDIFLLDATIYDEQFDQFWLAFGKLVNSVKQQWVNQK